MDKYLSKFDRGNSGVARQKQELRAKDSGMSSPDKLEKLKDENIKLKVKHQDMNTEIKVISTQLKRVVQHLKDDKMLPSSVAHFEKELDSVIEEQVKLKESEVSMKKKVKIA